MSEKRPTKIELQLSEEAIAAAMKAMIHQQQRDGVVRPWLHDLFTAAVSLMCFVVAFAVLYALLR
ncbi:MAG: hypothetical protein R3F56_04410 [Planctomycetota bacterium]